MLSPKQNLSYGSSLESHWEVPWKHHPQLRIQNKLKKASLGLWLTSGPARHLLAPLVLWDSDPQTCLELRPGSSEDKSLTHFPLFSLKCSGLRTALCSSPLGALCRASGWSFVMLSEWINEHWLIKELLHGLRCPGLSNLCFPKWALFETRWTWFLLEVICPAMFSIFKNKIQILSVTTEFKSEWTNLHQTRMVGLE